MTKLRTRLALLLNEMRSWEPGSPPEITASELAKRYSLDLDSVLALARSEGFRLADEVHPEWVDPNADTKPIMVRADVLSEEENTSH